MFASIIIPIKNAGSLLEHVFLSIEKQQKVSFEVIIIDSGSQDGSLEKSKGWADQVSFPVKIISIPANEFGHGKTRNLGAQNSKGEILVYLTQDASPATPNWLKSLIKPFEDKRVGLVFGPHLARPSTNPIIKNDLRTFFAGFALQQKTTIYGTKLDQGIDIVGVANSERMRFSSNVNAAIRKSAWQKCTFRDVSYCEDQLIARDLLRQGWLKVYEPLAAVYHAHDFASLEFFRRYVDEWAGLYRAFGHVEVKNILYLSLRLVRASLAVPSILMRDQDFSLIQKIKVTAKSFAIVWARQLGGYLGARLDNLPTWFKKRISREAHLIKA